MSWPEAFTYSVIMLSLCGLIGFIFWIFHKADEGTLRPIIEPPTFTYETTKNPIEKALEEIPEVKIAKQVE